MGHIERRQKEKEEIKRKILDAAKSIGCIEGWHSLTIRKIADAIDYTPPIVYEHFANKDDLIHEIIMDGFRTLNKESLKAFKEVKEPKEIIRVFSLIHWDFAFKNQELFRLMFSLERPILDENIRQGFIIVKQTFLMLAKDDEELMHELMFNWMCLINGAITIIMKTGKVPHQEDKEPIEIYKRMLNRFLDSL